MRNNYRLGCEQYVLSWGVNLRLRLSTVDSNKYGLVLDNVCIELRCLILHFIDN
jgi:hypothetical protein